MRRVDLGVLLLTSLLQGGCAGLFCIACDGYLGVEGRVYEGAEAPAGVYGKVLIDSSDARLPHPLQPVDGCDVELEPWGPRTRPKPETATLWTSRAKTNSDGWFKVGGTARPGTYDVTLTVRCPGFREVEHVFVHDRLRHDAVVTLVRDEAAPQGAGPQNNEMQRTKPTQAMELRR
jgi:hypothetical protein